MKMKRPTKERKKQVWERDKMICFYCKQLCTETNKTVDHIKPLHKGGSNDMENLVTACKKCNQEKGKKEEPKTFVYNKLDNRLALVYSKKGRN